MCLHCGLAPNPIYLIRVTINVLNLEAEMETSRYWSPAPQYLAFNTCLLLLHYVFPVEPEPETTLL